MEVPNCNVCSALRSVSEMDNGAASLRVVAIKESFCTELSQKCSIASKNTRVLTVGCYQKLVVEVTNFQKHI